MKIRKKQFTEQTVYEAALERFRTLFDRFDTVAVSFSGGKDSTVCLNLALQIAKEKNKLPLNVYFWDEEAIHPETFDYVTRVSELPEVKFKWLCIPIQHRNACSRAQPYWHPWNPDEKEKWVRNMPECAITKLNGFWWGAAVPDIAHLVYGPEYGTVADVRGIRADESLRRYQSVANKLKDNWIGGPRNGHNYPVSPIYDWTTFDVWTAPRMFGWDYNRAYDLMTMAGILPNQQRVCPPFGEEPLGGLWMYAQIWPDLWHKMINRVHGAATAGRYCTSELYGFGKLNLPDGMSWRDWAYSLLDLYPPKLKPKIAANLAALINAHSKKTRRPIPDNEPDPMTGLSWKYIAMIANRGDLKGRRKGNLTSFATNARKKKNVSIESVLEQDLGSRY